MHLFCSSQVIINEWEKGSCKLLCNLVIFIVDDKHCSGFFEVIMALPMRRNSMKQNYIHRLEWHVVIFLYFESVVGLN